MRSLTLVSATMALLFCMACGSKEKKDNPTLSEKEETNAVKTSEAKGAVLKQKGDYSQLYQESENCKLTATQLSEALGVAENQVTEKSNYKGSCWYEVTSEENLTTNYGVSLRELPEGLVKQEIASAMKSELIDIQVSESGDTYITRHPAQGFLMLLNPVYTNTVQVSYSYLNPNGPKLTEAQREERKQNTYKIANYLINNYKK